MKTKELLIFHAMGTTINLNTKLVKGTTTRLTNHANEDINEKVMISSQAIEIIEGVCVKLKGMGEVGIVTIKATKGSMNGVLWAIHQSIKLIIVDD